MDIHFASPDSHTAKLVALPVFQDDDGKNAETLLDDAGVKTLGAARIDGTPGRSTFLPAGDHTVMAVGAGKRESFNAESFAGEVVKSLITSGNTEVAVKIDGLDQSADASARAAAGARLAGYRFDGYRTKLKDHQRASLASVTIITDDPKAAQEAYDNFHGPATDGQLLARDLVNEPPNVIYPETYAERIQNLDVELEVKVLDETEMEALGMHSLLGVGKGSDRESRLVVMVHKGGKAGDAPAMLVGKGVTFDSGGISLKPGANMWDMKGDMGGSAAVVGTMYALAKRKAKANVVGIVGLVENMPDGRAQNPGDIVTSMSGQTIEVQNTDAEGRLVLADALYYGITEHKPQAVVDLATLTGAIIVSLGYEHAGLFTDDDALAEQLSSAGEASGDKVWRLPLNDAYDRQLDSPNADMKNIGGREAGSITAAQFLRRFVRAADEDVSWAHLDIAGTAMKNKRTDPREPTFGTGYGVRLLNHWIADNFEG